ncbi:MAG: TraR/DksA C4-type zinc finger protein [Ilumatobacter sp.]|uniref:TraR/DksA family transcriptional regulator n=1 Tax=Ilumatobacter sp. TaxID=1967498 RepID=UPI003C7661F9
MAEQQVDPRDVASLARRAADIEAQLVAIEAAAVTAVGGIGFGKRVGEGTNIAVERFSEVAIHDGLQQELAIVRRAEAKALDGDAGRCDACGSAIPAERLEAIPWAVRCVTCAT